MPGPLRRCLLVSLAALVSGCAGLGAQVNDGVATVPATPTPAPTPTTAPTPSLAPTLAATPTPDPSVMELETTSCEGGVVLEWSPSSHPNFHHYTALRSPEREIHTAYPPIAPAVDWGDTYATDRFVTSAVDASILPSDRLWSYRVMAYDVAGRVVSSSPVRTGRLGEPYDLGGAPRVRPGTGGATRVTWERYGGISACFTSYQVLHGANRLPTTVLSAIFDPDETTLATDALHAGLTYQLRVRAVRITTLGMIVIGESETVSYTVP
ncbi:MAG TPA: hypothetical protein VMP86_01455 [Candidatus Binatia bacterium]|nr:hypothetical protein [Candidatus Binatia bacterium]